MVDKTFNILSLDGGGIRGVFPAHIIKCIEERLNISIYEKFDMLAGTSTGSIIAAGIAFGKSPAEIVDLYQNNGEKIFSCKVKSWWPSWGKQGAHSKYANDELKNVLEAEFGGSVLGDIAKPLLIPSTDIGNGGVHIFKSGYSSQFTRDSSVLLKEAVLASCSAPTFFDPAQVGEYLLADGGIWANNPTLAAVIEAKNRLGVNVENIRVLSIGTGHSRTAYGTNNFKRWGLLTGWKGTGFIEFLLSLQAESIQNYIQLMLDRHQLMRVNFETDLPLPLDDFSIMEDLISRADKTFSYLSEDIKKFLD